MGLRILLVTVAATVAVVAAILWRLPAAPTALPQPDYGAAGNPPGPGSIELVDVTATWQVIPVHRQRSGHLSSALDTLGAGVCVIDADRDGWMDLFFVGGAGQTRDYGRSSWWSVPAGNRLLRNVGGRYLQDVTESAGLAGVMHGMGCAVGDLDDDGLPDLVVSGLRDIRVYRNEGGSRFADVSADSGLAAQGWATGVALADYNRDGLLDVYVGGFVSFEKGARTFERGSGFVPLVDAAFDPSLYDAQPNQLYMNLGGFSFRDVAAEVGVSNPEGRSLGARWEDVTGDGWLDLLVINGAGTANRLFLNRSGERFAAAGAEFSALESDGVRDVALADLDRDGTAEFILSRGQGSPPAMLFFSAEEGRWVDESWSRGLANARELSLSTWGVATGDIDNDGAVDVFFASGASVPDPDAAELPLGQPNRGYSNDGTGNMTRSWGGLEALPSSSRAAVTVDLNNDGRLEVVTTSNNDAWQILSASPSANHGLTLDLGALEVPAGVFPTRLEVETDQGSTQTAIAQPAGFLSQGDPRVHVGLGRSSAIRALAVGLSDGRWLELGPAGADQALRAAAPGELAPTPALPPPGHGYAMDRIFERATLADWVSVMLAGSTPAEVTNDLLAKWGAASAEARIAALNAAAAGGANWVSLVPTALADESPEVRGRAISLLREHELGVGLRWLAPLVSDQDPDVACDAAAALAHFFEEEEAVIHRKHLALPLLVRALETQPDEVVACVARALGAAESHRAIEPLSRIVRSSKAREARVAAIWALGRIRDRGAVPVLRRQAANRDAHPDVVAASLVALERLDDPEAPAWLDELLGAYAGEDSRRSFARRFELVASLLRADDAVVIARYDLEDRLASLLVEYLAAKGRPSAPWVAALRAIRASRAPRFLDAAAAGLQSTDLDAQVEALVAIGAIDSPGARERLRRELAVVPEDVGERAIAMMCEAARCPPVGVVAETYGRLPAISLSRILAQAPPGQAADLLDAALAWEAAPPDLLPLLRVCQDLGIPAGPPATTLWRRADALVRLEYARCYLGRVAFDDDAELTVEGRLHVREILEDPSLNAEVRSELTILAALADPLIARTKLLPELTGMRDDVLLSALKAFEGEPSTAVAAELRRIAGAPNRSFEVRLRAAALLSRTEPRVARELIGSEV